MERNSHTHKKATYRQWTKGRDGSVRDVNVANGVAVGNNRRFRRRLSPMLLKYSVEESQMDAVLAALTQEIPARPLGRSLRRFLA